MNFVNPNKMHDRRLNIFQRDKFKCYICLVDLNLNKNPDGTFPNDYATLDHVKPKCKGSGNNQRNLKACCFKCNNLKGGKWKEIKQFTTQQNNKPIKVNQPLLYKLLYKKEFA